MERQLEREETHILHMLSPAVSNISENSVATVVNSPSPSYSRQGFDCEPSSDRAPQDQNSSTVHLLSNDATIGSEALHTTSRDRSLHYSSAPPRRGTDGQTRSLDASKNPHVYHNLVQPDGLEKVHGNGIEIGKDLNSSFDFRPPNVKHKGRRDFFNFIILVISLYSTFMSGLWLVIAVRRPHWGRRISSHGTIKPDDASLVFTLLAKSIEISLSTAFVAFLGQKLSQRAFQQSKGVSIAEMSMRAWVVQPGTMLAHWNILRNGILSWLGLATFFAAWMAMLYTTASDALVSPRLLPGAVQNKMLYGNVSTSFGNIKYIKRQCQTPLTSKVDIDDSTNTCDDVVQAGQGLHNLGQYLSDWRNYTVPRNGSSDLRYRPRVSATLYDNTTVKGSWVEVWNMTNISKKHGRIVNNVTLAFPHPGVAVAAHDARNNIMQPSEFSGRGQYSIHASVSSPTVNVLCAGVSDGDLIPMNESRWPAGVPSYPSWLNSTAVDDVFGFGEKNQRRPPVFPKIPPPYNSILNNSVLESDSIYVLYTAADSSYMMCSLRAVLSVTCSTIYQASMRGGVLESHCEDHDDGNSYSKYLTNMTPAITQRDWSSVAGDWGTTVGLNGGKAPTNNSAARLLTQLIPEKPVLDTTIPSIAEGLAAFASSTLLLSAQDSPFVHYWNYTPNIITPVPQGFYATVKAYEYQSRYGQKWQQVFYIVLGGTFIVNCYCLIHLAWGRKIWMDVTEPVNLFDMGFSSLPSKGSEGAFAVARKKDRYGRKWAVKVDHGRLMHFESVTPRRSTEYGDESSSTEG